MVPGAWDADRVLRVAVVGAGPAGLYAADALLRARDAGRLPPATDGQALAVDVLDRLPAPFGLLRYGVAPDHHKIKRIATTLEAVLADPDVSYLGDVELGTDVTVADLRAGADAVVVACGASADRRLGVPGEDLTGSVSSTGVVAWYSGHPDAEPPGGLLDARDVVVVGVGNVAVDVARVLLLGPDALAPTDVPDDVLAALAGSRVRTVTLVGRRGAAQASWTHKELRELGELPGVAVDVEPADLQLDEASAALVAGSREAARCLEVLRGWAARPVDAGAPRRLRVRFLLSTEQLVPDGGGARVAALRVRRTRLSADGAAVPDGEVRDLPAQAVVRAVGYRARPLPGLPFDPARGVVPSQDGRVVEDGRVLPGLYVTGWLRRGPTGVVGTNRSDAAEVVSALLEDAGAGLLPVPVGPPPATVVADAGARPVVDLEGWRRLDSAEAARGALRGATRVKVTGWEALRRAASLEARRPHG